MNMFYYKWLRFPQYSVVYNKQLKLTVPTVHCFSVSRHVQCIWLAQLLLNTILYLFLKMSECEKSLWTRRVKWAMKVVSMSSPRYKKRLYADQKFWLKRRQDINPNGSFKDINALQSYNLFVSQSSQQGNRYNDTRVWRMDEGKIPYEGQQGLENSQELLWWRGKRWLLTNILIAVVIHGRNLGNRPVQTVFCNPLRFIIVVVFILQRSLMNSGPLFSALIAARYVCLVITCWALLT